MVFTSAIAQPARVARVKNGQDATRFVSAKTRYQFPEFMYGKLNYKNGGYAVSKLNYCYLLGEIMFIDAHGDTLAIANNQDVNFAEIGQTQYYTDPLNGYVEIVENCGTILLAKKEQFQKDGIEKHGAYQASNEQGAMANANTFTDITGNVTILPVNNTIVLKPTRTYLFIDGNRRFYKASRNSLLRVFAKQKNEVSHYLDQMNFDFSKEDDLKKAVRFCSELALR